MFRSWSRFIKREYRSTRSQKIARASVRLLVERLEDRMLLSGSWTTEAPMPSPLWGAGSAVINGQLYLAGGQDSTGFLNQVEEYNPATNTWALKAPMQTARFAPVTGVIDGKLYVAGGWNITGGLVDKLNTLEIYDPAANSWIMGAPMPLPAERAMGAVVDGAFYVIGGDPNINAVQVYDPTTNTWELKAPMPTGRQGAGSAAMGGIIYVAGGELGGGAPITGTLEAYDPSTNTWATKTSMPTPRDELTNSTGVINGAWYVVGGRINTAAQVNTLEIYDPATNAWATGPEMPTPREQAAAGVISNRLYVAGGRNGTTGFVAALEVFSQDQLMVSGFPLLTTAAQSQSFTVTALDPSGNTATGYTGQVHITSTDKKFVAFDPVTNLWSSDLSYTFTAADAGQHTFFARLFTAGSQSITATDIAHAFLPGTESGIAVVSAAPSHIKVFAPASSIAGTAFSLTVAALDPYGNAARGYTGTVHFTSTDKKAALPADYTFTATDAGVHTFKMALVTAGSQTITATDTVTATITGKSSSIKVSAAALNHLKVKAVTSTTAGTAFSITVTAQDSFNNTVTSYTGTVHFTSSDIQALLPPDYGFTPTDKGAHTFTSGVTLKTAGTQTVTATDTVTASVTGSASIAVRPGKAALFSFIAPSNVTQGVAFTFTVTALDAYGNVATGYTGMVHFSSSDGAASLPVNFTFTSNDAGVETFTAILNTTGSQSLTVTDALNPTITGSDLNIQVS